MNVGVRKVVVRLPENHSLKGKRRVISSLCTRIRGKFNVSVAEVDGHDAWQLASLGLSCVSNESRHAEQMLDNVVAYIEADKGGLELLSDEHETLSGF